MTVKEGIRHYLDHQLWNRRDGAVRKGALKNYEELLSKFQIRFSEHEVSSISAGDIRKFFEIIHGKS